MCLKVVIHRNVTAHTLKHSKKYNRAEIKIYYLPEYVLLKLKFWIASVRQCQVGKKNNICLLLSRGEKHTRRVGEIYNICQIEGLSFLFFIANYTYIVDMSL